VAKSCRIMRNSLGEGPWKRSAGKDKKTRPDHGRVSEWGSGDWQSMQGCPLAAVRMIWYPVCLRGFFRDCFPWPSSLSRLSSELQGTWLAPRICADPQENSLWLVFRDAER